MGNVSSGHTDKQRLERFKKVTRREGKPHELIGKFQFMPYFAFLESEMKKSLDENPYCSIPGCLCTHRPSSSTNPEDYSLLFWKLNKEMDIFPINHLLAGLLYGEKDKKSSCFFYNFVVSMNKINKDSGMLDKCQSVLSRSEFHHLLEFKTFFDEIDAVVN